MTFPRVPRRAERRIDLSLGLGPTVSAADSRRRKKLLRTARRPDNHGLRQRTRGRAGTAASSRQRMRGLGVDQLGASGFSRFEKLDALFLGFVHFALIYDAVRSVNRL